MKIIRNDNGVEFTSNPMKKFNKDEGIIHETISFKVVFEMSLQRTNYS